MKYNVKVTTLPENKIVEDTNYYAETDSEAIEYAMNQLCFTGQQYYVMAIKCYESHFTACE